MGLCVAIPDGHSVRHFPRSHLWKCKKLSKRPLTCPGLLCISPASARKIGTQPDYKCPGGGIGRRAGFRYQWLNGRGGSSPLLGTNQVQNPPQGGFFAFKSNDLRINPSKAINYCYTKLLHHHRPETSKNLLESYRSQHPDGYTTLLHQTIIPRLRNDFATPLRHGFRHHVGKLDDRSGDGAQPVRDDVKGLGNGQRKSPAQTVSAKLCGLTLNRSGDFGRTG